MSHFEARTYSGLSDLLSLIEFATTTTAQRWPRSTYMKAGDLVWALYQSRSERSEDVQIWYDDSRILAYALFERPMHFYFDVDLAGRLGDELLSEIADWAEARRRSADAFDDAVPRAYRMLGTNTIATTALESDPYRSFGLRHRGFVRSDDRYEVLFSIDLGDAVNLPPFEGTGLRIRHVTDADYEERVDVHRDSWSVWGPSHLTVPTYRLLRSAPLYEPELDLVLENSHGRFLSYCVCWLDRTNAIGHFEPVGCRPDSIGHGYARAVVFEGMRRMQKRGMKFALVATPNINRRALALYRSCGFVEVDRASHYIKASLPI